MISITEPHLSERLSPSEAQCDQHISQWLGKDISKGQRTKGDLVNEIHAASEKAVIDLQTSVKTLKNLPHENMPVYPYKQQIKFVGYCILSILAALVALGCFATMIAAASGAFHLTSSGALLGVIFSCAIGGSSLLVGTLYWSTPVINLADWNYQNAKSQYDKDLETTLVSHRTQLTTLASYVYRQEDPEWSRLSGDIAATTDQKAVKIVADKIRVRFEEMIAHIQRLQKDRLLLVNSIANHFITVSTDKATTALHTFIDAIRTIELSEAISSKMYASRNFDDRLIDLILSYLGIHKTNPAPLGQP